MALQIEGLTIPRFLYGTAWKEEETQRLVSAALKVGFTGIDTANQRKHYHEVGVGEALRLAFESGLARESLFLQTKFTHRDGQDSRLPYDANAPLSTQVRQSLESSLKHLHVEVMDSYLLHGPSARVGLPRGDLEVWRAMEELKAEGRVRLLGVSNVSKDQLALLCDQARTPPAFVQNRCYARLGWDREVRAFCREHDIIYQGFSLLTANAAELRHPHFKRIVARLGCTPAQAVFLFAQSVGMVCLTGSTNSQHLAEDLACSEFELSASEIQAIEAL